MHGEEKLWIMLFGFAFAVAGVFIFLGDWKRRRISLLNPEWPTVDAKMLSCNLEVRRYRTREDSGTVYTIQAAYQYTVMGSEYRSTRLHPCYKCHRIPTRRMNNLFGKLEHASIVRVHYNPDDPAESYLITGQPLFELTHAVFASLFLLAGVVILIVGALGYFYARVPGSKLTLGPPAYWAGTSAVLFIVGFLVFTRLRARYRTMNKWADAVEVIEQHSEEG